MTEIARRKDEHLDICLESPNTPSHATNGFERYRFVHNALPEVALKEIDLSTDFLGRMISAPIIVGAMTGGTDRAGEYNRRLARAAAECNIGMALGSQRAMLVDRGCAATFAVRKTVVELPLLIGNLGVSELSRGWSADDYRYLVDHIALDAIAFHTNPLQEAIQPKGDTDFRGIVEKLNSIRNIIQRPVILKEVGSGITRVVAERLRDRSIDAIEIAGVGGTSWALVEGRRSSDPLKQRLAETFAGWGTPTAEALVETHTACPLLPLIASGGIRTGLDIAKALRLGASAAAVARPLLVSADESVEAIIQFIETLIEELRLTCFLVGAKNIKDLKQVPFDTLS